MPRRARLSISPTYLTYLEIDFDVSRPCDYLRIHNISVCFVCSLPLFRLVLPVFIYTSITNAHNGIEYFFVVASTID